MKISIKSSNKTILFHSPIDHTRPLTDVRKAFWWALDRAELPRMRIHDLRHSFATLATSMGEDISWLIFYIDNQIMSIVFEPISD